VRSQHGTRLLPVAFPEGCPTHPSYPAAHACNAGACATILKAFFNTNLRSAAPGGGHGGRLGPGTLAGRPSHSRQRD
jgi:hypothetical protein